MARLEIMLNVILATLLSIASRPSNAIAVDADWDVSAADRIDHYPVGPLTWPARLDDWAFVKRTVHSSSDDYANLEPSIRRERRDTEMRSANLQEKLNAAENVREARMSSSESWSEQSSPVQFRQRESLEVAARDDFDDRNESTEVANLPALIRAHYAPKTDFVTSGKSRGAEGRHLPHPAEGRESRDMPVSRSYEDYDAPLFRNIVREHDFDVQLPRNYYYPNRYRSQRDYYPYRKPSYDTYYDRYREDDNLDYDTYPSYRPTPKPKRIIYYATLPEIVRKPNDVRTYPTAPYVPLVRPEAQIEADRVRLGPNTIEPSRRPLAYPYDNYDSYVKRSSYYERRRPSYFAAPDDRFNDHDRSQWNFRDKMRSDVRKNENQIGRTDYRRPALRPLQIGAQVNVKENERIPGRKIFGQVQGDERFERSRIKKTSGNAENKEDNDEANDNYENLDSNNNTNSN